MLKNVNLFETVWDLMSQVALVVKNLLANAGDKRHNFNHWVNLITYQGI